MLKLMFELSVRQMRQLGLTLYLFQEVIKVYFMVESLSQ